MEGNEGTSSEEKLGVAVDNNNDEVTLASSSESLLESGVSEQQHDLKVSKTADLEMELDLRDYRAPSRRVGSGFSGNFRDILFEYLDKPATHKDDIYYKNKDITVIYDAYPKARVHLLVIPNRNFLRCNGIEHLTPTNLTRLKILHTLARNIAASEKLQASAPKSKILLGYHMAPSLNPLHLHIISDDFVSDSLKTKKHWNSFTTDFFVPPEKVEHWLEDGSASLTQVLGSKEERLGRLDEPLRCHLCPTQFKNIPQLKDHVAAAHVR